MSQDSKVGGHPRGVAAHELEYPMCIFLVFVCLSSWLAYDPCVPFLGKTYNCCPMLCCKKHLLPFTAVHVLVTP